MSAGDGYNQAAYAAHRGVSRKTVTGWKQRGLLVFTDSGKVDVEASDAALAAHGVRWADEAPGNKTEVVVNAGETPEDAADRIVNVEGRAEWSKAEAERVKENYAARLKQLEYDRQSGQVVDIDDVVIAVASEYAILRSRFLDIGSKVAPRVAVLKSAEEIKAIIDAQVVEALTELTVDDGERDFERLRQSVRDRFGASVDEVEESQERGA